MKAVASESPSVVRFEDLRLSFPNGKVSGRQRYGKCPECEKMGLRVPLMEGGFLFIHTVNHFSDGKRSIGELCFSPPQGKQNRKKKVVKK